MRFKLFLVVVGMLVWISSAKAHLQSLLRDWLAHLLVQPQPGGG
jgi:hypothetical protein